MALRNTIDTMQKLLTQITSDLDKAEGGNKAAAQRVRTGTVKLEKTAKQYRKESINDENSKKGTSRRSSSSKKSSAKSATAKSKSSSKSSSKGGKSKTNSKSTKVSPRAFQLRKPTAKLPTKKYSGVR